MNYNTFINFNQNITELKNENDSSKLIKHVLDNTKRRNDKELINKNPELKDIELKEIDLNKIKKDLEQTKKLKKGGKGAKPFRFITTTLNVEPTKANEKIIKEWGERMKGLYSKYFNIEGMKIHLNETRPHIHIIAKNFNDKEWGNFVDGKKVKLSGEEGRKLMEQIWKEGEAINRELAKKYNLQFRQEPVTKKGDNRKVKQFRQKLANEDISTDELDKIVKYLQDKNLIKTNDADVKMLLAKKEVKALFLKERERADYNGHGWEAEIKKNEELLNEIDALKAELGALEARKPKSKGRGIGGH